MASANPFDLLLDDDSDDLSQLVAAQEKKIAARKPAQSPAPATASKMPSKPLPPAQAVREAKSAAAAPRGGGGGRGGPGRGRGGRGGPGGRDFGNGNANGYGGGFGGGGEERDGGRTGERERGPYSGPRQPYRGGRRGGFGNGESGGEFEQPRRTYERRSGTGHGYEMKRDGAGRGNWGNADDDASFAQETENNANVQGMIASEEKKTGKEDALLTEGVNKDEDREKEAAEKEKEDKEMTLEEYEKINEEKRKALLAMKTEERKVEIDNELKSMQQLSLKKGNDDIFIKLGSDKEKKKENIDRDERVKKSLNINEFLKPAEGERAYSSGGRGGRGRGRVDRGSFRGGFGGGAAATLSSAPAIADPGEFPTLGGKK